MITLKNIITAAAFLCAAPSYAVAYAVASTPADQQTVQQLNTFRQQYAKSMLAGNPEPLLSYFADGIRLMPEFQKTVMGKSNVLGYHKAFAERLKVQSYDRTAIEMLDLGAQVLEIGTLCLTFSAKATGEEHTLNGAYLNLWQKAAGGRLQLITEAWNYDRWYDGADQLLRFETVPAVHTAFLPNVPVNSSISFELAALNRLLDATVTQHDGKVWAQFYADDAMLIPNHQPIQNGRKAIDEYIEKHAVELPVFEELDIRNNRIDNLGGYVIEYAGHIASWKNRGTTGVGLGKNIRIWRREPDHSLKLFRSIVMYD